MGGGLVLSLLIATAAPAGLNLGFGGEAVDPSVTTEAPKAPDPKAKTEKQRQVVVRAIRNCPEAKSPDEVVVCSKDRGVAEAYRLPKADPRYEAGGERAGKPAISVGNGQALASGNCSAAGSAGQTGCALGEANAWGADKKDRKKNGQWYPW